MSDSEIIEAIATKVMGWTVCPPMTRKPGDSVFKDVLGIIHIQRGGRCWQWNPLTDPADSKLVREKLAETHGWHMSWLPDAKIFNFSAWPRDVIGGGILETEADTEERAVAKCALLSVGVEV